MVTIEQPSVDSQIREGNQHIALWKTINSEEGSKGEGRVQVNFSKPENS